VLVPAVPGSAEVDLSAILGIPIFGPDPRNYASLASKSALPGLARLARVSCPHTELDIGPDEFYARFAETVKRTGAKKWVLKIDDEMQGRGSVLVDLTDYWRHIVQVDTVGCAEIMEYVLRGVKPAAVETYPTFRHFLDEFRRVGGVLQQVPEGIVGSPSVHVLIEPDGHVEVLGTTEAMRAPLAHFTAAAHMSPHSSGGHAVVAAGLRVGRALAMKGVFGFATVDLVVYASPDYDARNRVAASRDLGTEPTILMADAPEESRMFTAGATPEPEASLAAPVMGGNTALQTQLGLVLDPLAPTAAPEDFMVDPDPPSRALRHLAAVVDVDLRATDAAVAVQMLQFVADCESTPRGELVYRPTQEPRFMLLAPVVAPRLRNTSCSALFANAKQKGVSFDLLSFLGALFVELDLHAGRVTLGCVASTQPAAVHAALHALETVDRGGRKPEVGPHVPPPAHGAHIAAAIAALRVVQRRLDKQRAILHRD